MGLQPSSAHFQKAMDLLLSGLQPELCISYIDDCIIHSCGDFDDHLVVLVRVLDRIGGGGYTLRTRFGLRSAGSVTLAWSSWVI